MNIAINTRVLNGNEVAAMLLNKKFEQLALLHTEHNFIFISANEEFNTKNAIKNIQTISLKQSSKNWLYFFG
jgi:hypothetical protein